MVQLRRFTACSVGLLLGTYLSFKTLSQDAFIRGADFSAVGQVESHGGVYKENGIPTDPFEILSAHGVNFIRLRIWHTPANGTHNLQETLTIARRISDAAMGFLLNIHYSDSWADPGQQTKPAAWQGLPFEVLKDSVYRYTSDVIVALRDQNTLPGMVQIGNEIICGLLWDDGRVCDGFNTPQQWAQLGELLNEGIRAVRENTDPSDSVKIVIHIDRGGDNSGSRWFFDNLAGDVDEFDIIGQSFYPWWHGTPADLEFNFNDLAFRYGKPLILVEAAYPWTLAWYDQTHNIVGKPGQLLAGYPASVDGQTAYLTDIVTIVRNVPVGKGAGFFYWGTELIPAPQLGSVWENVTLFDFQGEVLTSIEAFEPVPSSVQTPDLRGDQFFLHQNFPNPFNPETTIRYSLGRAGDIILDVYSQLGVKVATLVNEWQPAGVHAVRWDGRNQNGIRVSSGVYYFRLVTDPERIQRSMVLLH